MLINRPKIMGILNVTPDSFSDGGRFTDIQRAAAHAHDMVQAGADIIDIGGESTRPGAAEITTDEELTRVLPVIEALKNIPAEISIDTRRPDAARAAVEAGASIWNDVTALTFAEHSPQTAAELGCKIVLMHMQGRPETMQNSPKYINVVAEIVAYLKVRMSTALAAGVKRENIILDPGIGFGKRLEDNLDVLQGLDDFHMLGQSLLIGASNKSFIGHIDESDVENRLGGSIASALWAASMGASILRVHNVKETVQALRVWHAIWERENV
jgi:dihydropteroate synthase